jgi:hypothetical protein
MAAAFPLVVRGLNRAGLGPVNAEVSPVELRRSALLAMGEVTARLGLDQGWVIFGHTHRVGPREGDDPAEWRGRSGVGLVNTGSWVHERVFIDRAGATSPYWPGHVVEVDPEPGTAPRVRALLADATF